jgi:hypothetical protein
MAGRGKSLKPSNRLAGKSQKVDSGNSTRGRQYRISIYCCGRSKLGAALIRASARNTGYISPIHLPKPFGNSHILLRCCFYRFIAVSCIKFTIQ